MRFLTRILVLFYVTLTLYISAFMFLFAIGWLKWESWSRLFSYSLADEQLRVVWMVIAGVLVLINYIFYEVFSVNVHKEKIIAFDNPSGRVTVSLSALEDIIDRLLVKFYEVKKSKTVILAVKKGLSVKIRLVLQEEVNIPESTLHVQNAVKNKLQDIVGIIEPIDIKVYVRKFLGDGVKDKDISDADSQEKILNVPYQGYRA